MGGALSHRSTLLIRVKEKLLKNVRGRRGDGNWEHDRQSRFSVSKISRFCLSKIPKDGDDHGVFGSGHWSSQLQYGNSERSRQRIGVAGESSALFGIAGVSSP